MPHRFEASSNGRAGCQNPECKAAKVKIKKGELRVGTWVEADSFQAWLWRHWGCTTPAVIANLLKEVENMFAGATIEHLDGFNELPEEFKAKVRRALDQGHVDDEDWKGDVALNRPGKRGFRLRGSQAPKVEEAEAEAARQDNTSGDEKSISNDKENAFQEDSGASTRSAVSEAQPKKKGASTTKKAATAPVKTQAAKKGTSTAAKTTAPVKTQAKKGASTATKATAAGTKTQSKKGTSTTTKATAAATKAPASKKGTSTKKAPAAPAKTQAKKRSHTAHTTEPKVVVESPKKSAKDSSEPSEREMRALRRNAYQLAKEAVQQELEKKVEEQTDEQVKTEEPSPKRARLMTPVDSDEPVQNEPAQNNEDTTQTKETPAEFQNTSTRVEDTSAQIEEASTEIEDANIKVENTSSQVEEPSSEIEEASTQIEDASTQIEDTAAPIKGEVTASLPDGN